MAGFPVIPAFDIETDDLEYVDAEAAGKVHCPMCLSVFFDPVLVCREEHHLCRPCAERLACGPKRACVCPTCRRKLHIRPGQRFLRGVVNELLVRCPSRGCAETPTREALPSHLGVCPFVVIKCDHCEATMERRQFAAAHHHCDAARWGCEFVGSGDVEVSVHLAECAVFRCRRMFERFEQEIADLRCAAVPAGAMLPWHGPASRLPGGWAFCDGEDGRPDRTEDAIEKHQSKRRRTAAGVSADETWYDFVYITRDAGGQDDQVQVAEEEEEEEEDVQEEELIQEEEEEEEEIEEDGVE